MALFDISVPISDALPVWEGDPPTRVELWQSMAGGAVADVRSLRMGTHTGTHVDAPAHFLAGGRTVDQLDLEVCIGPAQVMDLTEVGDGLIGRADIAGRLEPGVSRLLLKTQNSGLWPRSEFQHVFAALSEPAAEFLVGQGVRLIGIDYLSIAPSDDPRPVHETLLAAGVVILEGLDLSAVPAGSYTLICLPLKLESAEGAPARAVLLS